MSRYGLRGMRSLPVLDRGAPPRARACGDCTLCCTTMAVSEIGKPYNEPCGALACAPARGCSIYKTRPRGCRDFSCLWAQGLLPGSLRPDKVRAVASMNGRGDIVVLHVLPEDLGPEGDRVFDREPLATWIRDTAAEGVSVVISAGGAESPQARRFAFGPITERLDVNAL